MRHNDGLDDDAENFYGTDPLNPDTDGGGAFDGLEVFQDGTDPLDPSDDILMDSDGDGLSDLEEITLFGTDPTKPDTDSDALDDGNEVLIYNTNSLNPDTDGGGAFDGQEIYIDGTNPFDPNDDILPLDQDSDGFPIGQDCDDQDPSINPVAEEIWYDGIDQNCDGNDTDQDLDGFPIDQDCDDTNFFMSPGLSEFCDGYDNNCNGAIDEQGPCIAVHLTWQTPADPDETDNFGSDLDLHFLNPNGEWWELPWDCFWQNKSLNWGDPNTHLDDPELIIDEDNGVGPEIIRLPNPEAGAIYKIGVDYYSAKGFGPSNALVKIYINGQMAFEETSQPLNEKDFWEAAAIDWDAGVVTSLSDFDDDGILDAMDNCPDSILNEIIIIDGCDSGVMNHLDSEGCTISDQIAACGFDAKSHGKFVSCVAQLTNELEREGVISNKEKGALQRCTARAYIP